MKPIAIWYHCKLSGIGIPDSNLAWAIFVGQMMLLKECGLLEAAQEFHIRINGVLTEAQRISRVVPTADVLPNRYGQRSELPTFAHLRAWLKTHPDWYVLYHHSKGVTKPTCPVRRNQRNRMEEHVIKNWKTCVADLDKGYEAVGINMVHPKKRPAQPGRYFAGNFWWANSNYLRTLPTIPDSVKQYCDPERCVAEGWVGSGKGEPKFMDYERPELYRLPELERA